MSAAQCLSIGAEIRLSEPGTESGIMALRDSGTQGAKLVALLDLCPLVRAPSSTVGALPKLGSTTWIRAGAPGGELVALQPELARCAWPQEVTCAHVWRLARKRNQFFVLRSQQCL